MKQLSLLAAALLLSACAVSRSQQTTPRNSVASPSVPTSVPRESNAVQNRSIRSIDFKNFTFDWWPSWANAPATPKKIILKAGTMDLGHHWGKEPREFVLTQVEYGDLTSDNNEEAIVVMATITSGTARPFLIFVYAITDNGPKRLWVYQTGDRSDHGFHAVSVQDGELLVELYKPKIVEYEGKKIQMAESDTYLRDYYKWDGTDFRKMKTEELPINPDDKSPWVSRTNR
jgi:hypothetical protein